MHLIEYNIDTIEYLDNIILNFFEKKTKINKENCFNLKENFDILLLLLIFLNKYQSLINEQDLSFYNFDIFLMNVYLLLYIFYIDMVLIY